jgi:hypothetical protein
MDVAQVGAPSPSTEMVFEVHVLVPPAPTAVSVTKCVPGRKVSISEPVHATSPWSTPSTAQRQVLPSLDHSTANIVVGLPLEGPIEAEHRGGIPSVPESTAESIRDSPPSG